MDEPPNSEGLLPDPVDETAPADAEELHAPPPPVVRVDPRTGRLPFGWDWADD